MPYTIADVAEPPKKKKYTVADVDESANNLSLLDTAKVAVTKALPAVGKAFGSTMQQMGKGVVSSFGKDMRTPEEAIMEGSVMASPEQKSGELSRKIGGFVGDTVQLIASELATGTPSGLLIAKYGLGPVKAAMTKMALTMGTYEGLKGAERGQNPLQTTGDIATGAIGGLGLGAAGYGVGKAADFMTKRFPEVLANQYLDTPKAMADALKREGKPGLGKTFLEKTKYGAGQRKNEVYESIGSEIEKNNFAIEEKLKQRASQAVSPGEKIKVKGTLGEQIPTKFNKDTVIDYDEIRNSLNSVAEEQRAIGKPETAQAILDLQKEIAPGKKFADLMEANNLRKMLDAEVNNAYLKTPNNIPPGTEARQIFANTLRQKISELAPEVAGLNQRNHHLINFRLALLPQVSERAPIAPSGEIIRHAIRGAIGNRGGLGVARALSSPVTEKTVKSAEPVTRQAGALGLSKMLEDIQRKGKR